MPSNNIIAIMKVAKPSRTCQSFFLSLLFSSLSSPVRVRKKPKKEMTNLMEKTSGIRERTWANDKDPRRIYDEATGHASIEKHMYVIYT